MTTNIRNTYAQLLIGLRQSGQTIEIFPALLRLQANFPNEASNQPVICKAGVDFS